MLTEQSVRDLRDWFSKCELGGARLDAFALCDEWLELRHWEARELAEVAIEAARRFLRYDMAPTDLEQAIFAYDEALPKDPFPPLSYRPWGHDSAERVAAAEWQAKVLLRALLRACQDSDYCYVCDQHPTPQGHAAHCPLSGTESAG